MAEKHMNLFAVGDPDQSIYAFRGADIRNIMEFEADFPGTRVIPLEQNYRSTNTILRGSNAVIANNRERKPKELWSELGEGEPIHVIEVEDEHAEARFVAAEIARLVEEGFSGSEVAIFYRTNAQSRVLEDVLVRQAIQYQVIGGPRFYERAEIKDVIAYLQVIDNPYDAVSLMRIANRPRRGIGDTTIARLQTYADAHGISLWEATEFPEEAGVGAAPLKAVQAFRTLLQSLMAGALELTVPELVERVLERSGYTDALEAERTIEAQGRLENLQELVGAAQEYQAAADEPMPLQLPPGDLALRRPGRDPRRAEPRHADDAPQREGARVPRRLHDRDGGGDLPALALDRGGDARGGAAPRVRRDDAREGAADAHARLVALALGLAELQPPVTLHRRAPRAGRRARAAAARPPGRTTAARQKVAPRTDVPDLSTGDNVRHGTLGEGVVTAIDAGGVVTVRFADGVERRLILEYAPLERI